MYGDSGWGGVTLLTPGLAHTGVNASTTAARSISSYTAPTFQALNTTKVLVAGQGQSQSWGWTQDQGKSLG